MVLGLTDAERQQLATARDVDAVLVVARSAARRLADADGATVVLREGDRCFYADEDAIAPLWKGQRFPISECISGWSMLRGEVAVVPDISVDARVPAEAYRPTFVRSLAMMPVGSPAMGAIGVYWRETGEPPRLLLSGLRELADLTAVALTGVGIDALPWAPNFRDDARTERARS